jgi:hypothetical protein
MSDKPKSDIPGFDTAIGTYEEALTHVGKMGPLFFADVPVNWPMIKVYCSMTEDDNPSYWSEDYAQKQWGDIIMPPGMLQVFEYPLPWRPGGLTAMTNVVMAAPLPGEKGVVVSTEVEYFRPIKVGEHLNKQDELVSISEEKKTRLGVGHFLTDVKTFRNQTGEIVARVTGVSFRYIPNKEGEA